MVTKKSKFEFFRKNNFVYLDNAATTQVPNEVVHAVKISLENRGNPHRGAHTLATKNEEKITLARENVARFLNCSSDEIVFTNNTTDSINLAVDSILHKIKKGDEIIIPIGEHHSNLLPFDKLIKKGAILKTVNLTEGIINVPELEKLLTKKTKVVALQHCSNVLGSIQPVEKIGKIIKKYNPEILYLVDGAQAVAHLPVNLKKIKCDFYSFSGHKMYAPSGIGVLTISKKIWKIISPVRQGGGTISDASISTSKLKSTLVYEKIPSLIGLEGGTPNVEGIIGISEACNFIRSIGFEEIVSHEQELLQLVTEKLSEIEDITILGPKKLKQKIGVISFTIKDQDIKEMGDYLNKRKIAIRYGSHCAFPLIEELGSETIRISLGCYNDTEDIERVTQEIKFYLDKKKGLIKNPNLEKFRNFVYYRNTDSVQSSNEIGRRLFSKLSDLTETSVVIMAGHFLAIPDTETNTFHPSIKPLLPERLHKLLDEFGMTSFPLFTWELGCELVKKLKYQDVDAKLLIIANDTTGLNELKNSDTNKDKKTAEDYRKEFLNRFGRDQIPRCYEEILKKHNLTKEDILTFDDGQYYVKESLLRHRFKKFIAKNKGFFEGMINYTTDKQGHLDISMNILDNQEIKTCTFNNFNSKTGGKFCIAELTELCAELFGKSCKVDYKFVPSFVRKNKINAKENLFVMLSPEMCNNAVSRSAELYNKIYLQEKFENKFKFITIPFGPDAERSLAIGGEMTYISDKDSLVELEVEKSPTFSEIWGLNEYNLLYDADDHLEDILNIFSKIKITKKSKILDSCVGPGFMTTELIERGYPIMSNDRNKENVKPFIKKLKTKGIFPRITHNEWLDLRKLYKKNSLDLIFNKGNTFIYADGGFQKDIPIDKNKSLESYRKTLKIYYDLLKKGGHLYIDKFKDSEIPAEKTAARLKISDSKEKKDLIFKVERKPEKGYRFASISLKDKENNLESHSFTAYDLTEDEMETLLKETGFEVKRLNLKSEKHFVVWLAKK